jgi:acyl-CoA dehydrogenase
MVDPMVLQVIDGGREDSPDIAVLDALAAPSIATGSLAAAAWRIGAEIAAPNAEDVDTASRFPSETIDALRAEGLLAALVPVELGGQGARLIDVAGAVRALAAHCASSALVLAMHSIEVFNLARHGSTPGLQAVLADVAGKGLLLANANSEVGIGGDVSRSRCGLESDGDGWQLEKDCLAISYGEYADAIVTIARRTADAAETDQVMMVVPKSDFTLQKISEWNTMGLRGTCSSGFHLSAKVAADAIFPVPFAVIANDGAAQARQILLSAAWVGLAEAAGSRAHAFVRAAAKKSIGTLPPAAVHLAELAAGIQQGRSLLAASALHFEALDRAGDAQNAGLMVTLRAMKVSTSELAVRTATNALGICGMAGFGRATPFAMDRIVRDSHGSLVMVSNDRLMADNAQLLIVRKGL